MHSCVIIPAFQPGPELVFYVKKLLEADIGPLLILDDGSSDLCRPIFDTLSHWDRCTVLSHPRNQGKGAALKTAIRWYRTHQNDLYQDCCGVVTADCDGQHSVEDVRRVAQCLAQCPGSLVLGCRNFGPDTPPRSAAGNRFTSWAMHALYDIDLPDTQTGLRGLPNSLLTQAEELHGDRYEYELNMLLWAHHASIPFEILTIKTIYFDNNSGSHYRTILDSARILIQLLRGLMQYAFSSLASALVDVAAYALLVKWVLAPLAMTQRIFFATVIARIVSSLVNYACNRRLPYMQNKQVSSTVVRYYILWIFQLATSFGFSWVLCTFLSFDELVAKYMVDLILALLSYQIQLRWVFRSPKEV